MKGTVNISRKIWDDPAFKKEPFTQREAFIWLVMEASWKPREKRAGSVMVNLERGQLVSSVRFMGEAWGWTKSRVHRFLDVLKNRDMIGTESGTGILVVTIRKYNEYQNTPNYNGTPRETESGQQRDSSGTNYNKGLIPDNTFANAKDGAAVDATSDAIWKRGVPFLMERHVPEPKARSMIGKWLSQAGSAKLYDALKDAAASPTQDPIPYITAILNKPEQATVSDLMAMAKEINANR